jgi:hypothetical protein
VPVVYHPSREARFEPFPRKARTSPAEALAYATRVIWHRQRRAAEKRRRIEALAHPRYATWAEYVASPHEQQRAFWAATLARWADNHQRELDADYAFDRASARADWEWCQ